MTIKKFIIEFYLERDCCHPEIVGEKKTLDRIAEKAGELALQKYLASPNSPVSQYSFIKTYLIHSVYLDNGGFQDDTSQIKSVVEDINSFVSREDLVVVHIWGHADHYGVGSSEYHTLVDILHLIQCSHLCINLMNSCFTVGAKEYGDESTTIWYSNGRVPTSSPIGFDPSVDDPEKFTLPDGGDKDFDIPFIIYDCWDEGQSRFDFTAFISKVKKMGGIADLYGTTD